MYVYKKVFLCIYAQSNIFIIILASLGLIKTNDFRFLSVSYSFLSVIYI